MFAYRPEAVIEEKPTGNEPVRLTARKSGPPPAMELRSPDSFPNLIGADSSPTVRGPLVEEAYLSGRPEIPHRKAAR